MFSAVQSEQRALTDPIMHIVEVEGFQDVRQALDLVALRRPQWFQRGLQGVHAVSNNDFFAAFTDGHFYISTAESAELKFSPARELVSAMADIRACKPLSFNQEYAVEVLQHELVHSAYSAVREAQHTFGADSFEECLVQLFARLRYPDLLRMLGAEPRHEAAILSDGYAYHKGTRNLVEIMRHAGLVDAEIEQLLRQDAPRDAFKQMLAQRLGTSEKKAGWLLTHAATKPLDDFLAKLFQLQAYARPPGTG